MLQRFGIGRRLEQRTGLNQFTPQSARVGEITVMGQRKTAETEVGIKRLDVAECRFALSGITHMANRRIARQPSDDIRIAENVAYETEIAVRMESPTVK